eukprot:UN05244
MTSLSSVDPVKLEQLRQLFEDAKEYGVNYTSPHRSIFTEDIIKQRFEHPGRKDENDADGAFRTQYNAIMRRLMPSNGFPAEFLAFYT